MERVGLRDVGVKEQLEVVRYAEMAICPQLRGNVVVTAAAPSSRRTSRAGSTPGGAVHHLEVDRQALTGGVLPGDYAA
ncbi:MAG TPA: hypothetical protein VFW65_16045 [Pseudonocardiaceae bacterium]|nr:hypothetical protein [Pseudonocardiaceae bacterium]